MTLTLDLRGATLAGMSIPFHKWFQEKLEEKGMTQADVVHAVDGEVKRSQISRVYNGEGGYDAPTVRTIAKALHLPQAEVFYAAGLLTEPPSEPSLADPVKADIWRMLERMDSEQLIGLKMLAEIVLNRGVNDAPRGLARRR